MRRRPFSKPCGTSTSPLPPASTFSSVGGGPTRAPSIETVLQREAEAPSCTHAHALIYCTTTLYSCPPSESHCLPPTAPSLIASRGFMPIAYLYLVLALLLRRRPPTLREHLALGDPLLFLLWRPALPTTPPPSGLEAAAHRATAGQVALRRSPGSTYTHPQINITPPASYSPSHPPPGMA